MSTTSTPACARCSSTPIRESGSPGTARSEALRSCRTAGAEFRGQGTVFRPTILRSPARWQERWRPSPPWEFPMAPPQKTASPKKAPPTLPPAKKVPPRKPGSVICPLSGWEVMPAKPNLSERTLKRLRQKLMDERDQQIHQAEDLQHEAEELAQERDPGDTQFD